MKVHDAKDIVSSSLIGLLLVSILVIAGNQTSYVKAEEPPSELTASSSASSDEVAGASGSNRFVVWQDVAGEGPADIFLRRSTDNGATWKTAVNLSKNPGYSTTPLIAVSGSNVYVVWIQYSTDFATQDIFLRRSTDNGVTWGGKVKLTSGTNSCDGGCFFLSDIAGSGSNVYVIWHNNAYLNPGEIYLRRSTDNGATWKPVFNLSTNSGSSFDPSIAVSGDNVYLTWSQANTANTSHDILFRRSTDGGATWKSKVNLSNDSGFSHRPDIAASGSNVYVTWNGDVTYPDGRTFLGIFFKNSSDGGATWASVKNLSDHPINDPSDDGEMVGALSPQVVASGSNVYMAWFDNVFLVEKASGSMDVVFRRSLDGGNTWDPVVMVDDANGSEGCNLIELAVSGTTAYLAWLLTDEGCNHGGIEFSRSTDNGATWSPSRSMADVFLKSTLRSTLNLAVSNSSVFLVIARDMGGPGSDIFIARSTNAGETWGLGINLSKTSGISDDPQIGL